MAGIILVAVVALLLPSNAAGQTTACDGEPSGTGEKVALAFGDTSNTGNSFVNMCGTDGNDASFLWTAVQGGLYEFTMDGSTPGFEPTFSIYSGTGDCPGTILTCEMAPFSVFVNPGDTLRFVIDGGNSNGQWVVSSAFLGAPKPCGSFTPQRRCKCCCDCCCLFCLGEHNRDFVHI